MNKKIIIVAGIVTVLSIVITLSILASNNNENFEETFSVDAVYFEQTGIVEITFEDKSEKTSLVTLEVLGMQESFQKKFTSSSFVERIPLQSVPKYGWSSIPVTFVVEHEEFGKLGIKTEIRPAGEAPAKIIFTRNLD